MVRQVVEQGQCIREKSITLTAVDQVHPFSIKSCRSIVRLFISTRLPVDRYAIIIIGTTISLAGRPRINASKITPSIPSIWAKGSKKCAQCANSVMSPALRLANSQINNPAAPLPPRPGPEQTWSGQKSSGRLLFRSAGAIGRKLQCKRRGDSF